MASLRTWFRATQPHSFVASLVGVALGTAVAWNSTRMFDLVAFLLAALGSYVVQTGAVGWEPLLASIPLGLLVAAFLLVNEMPEHETDPRGGKRTIPARIGLEKSVTLYEVLVATALIFLVATSLLRLVPWVAVIGLVAVLPLARARAVLRTYYREYPAHIAANAGTIQAVLLLGAGMTAAYVIAGTTAL